MLAKLGEPKSRRTDEGHDIWDYEVGQTRELDISYSVLFDGDRGEATLRFPQAAKAHLEALRRLPL